MKHILDRLLWVAKILQRAIQVQQFLLINTDFVADGSLPFSKCPWFRVIRVNVKQ